MSSKGVALARALALPLCGTGKLYTENPSLVRTHFGFLSDDHASWRKMVIDYSYGKPLLQEGLSLFNKSLGHYSTASSFRSVLYDMLAVGDSWASVALPPGAKPFWR